MDLFRCLITIVGVKLSIEIVSILILRIFCSGIEINKLEAIVFGHACGSFFYFFGGGATRLPPIIQALVVKLILFLGLMVRWCLRLVALISFFLHLLNDIAEDPDGLLGHSIDSIQIQGWFIRMLAGLFRGCKDSLDGPVVDNHSVFLLRVCLIEVEESC